ETHLFEFLADRVVSHVFAPRQFAAAADIFGAHDLVGFPVSNDAMLMDAGFVRERIVADDGFVALDYHAGHVTYQPAGRIKLRGVDAGMIAGKGVLARAKRHDDFFQRSVAGTFADAVDGALDLPGAVLDGRQ